MLFSPFFYQAASGGIEVANSLRFRGGQQLSQTFSENFSSTRTVSLWYKTNAKSTTTAPYYPVLWSHSSEAYSGYRLYTDYNGSLRIYTNGVWVTQLETPYYRDPSAWYHQVIQITDGTQTKIWVNGVLIKDASSSWGTPNSMQFGNYGTSATYYLDGYIADVNVVDGQALEASFFGEFNDNGVWVPKKYGGTYGTNGFKLEFTDPTNVGLDTSGNGNDFTATGFETTDASSSDYDWMFDSPTQNWATWNTLAVSSPAVLTNANLYANTGASNNVIPATQAVSSGKFYWEYVQNVQSSFYTVLGIQLSSVTDNKSTSNSKYLGSDANGYAYEADAYKIHDGVKTSYGVNYNNRNDVIGVALDLDGGELTFFVNGESQGVAFSGISGSFVPAQGSSNSGSSTQSSVNFGQHPFVYSPPEGFEPLQTQNLSKPSILNGTDGFRALTGDGATILDIAQGTAGGAGIPGWGPVTGFAEGLWWIVNRQSYQAWQMVDSVNGTSDVMQQNNGSSGNAYFNPSGDSVAWCWKADVKYGFSITDGTHNLGAEPAMAVSRSGALWHRSLTPGYGLNLNNDAAASNQGWVVDETEISGPGGGTYYVWSEIPGYSAFNEYTGNGNADGPFIYCGFRPAWVITKSWTTGSGDWHWFVYDSTTNEYNPADHMFIPNYKSPENTFSSCAIDLLSNGFKLRGTNYASNSSGVKYIYAAFAEHPFGGEDISPVTAR